MAGDAPEAVLFACTLNAVRSPMAAAILSHLTGARIKVASAGVKLGHPDPFAVAVMDEIGIDISEHEPTVIADLGNATFDLIITLSPEAQHHAVELTRTMAADVEHWPTLDGWGCAFEELALRAGDFALAMAAAALRCENGQVVEARVGIGATVDRPTLLETDLVGVQVTEDVAGGLGARASARAEPAESIHASIPYQRCLTALMVERAVMRAWQDAPGGAP